MTAKQLSWQNINIFDFQLLSPLKSDGLFLFNIATMFYQDSTKFTLPPLKNVINHLLIMQYMVIPFFFTCKSPALHKYASSSSLSKSSKFLILQFLVTCCKLHSAFKILKKSHMLDIFLISSVYYKCSYKLWIDSLKEFKQPKSIRQLS